MSASRLFASALFKQTLMGLGPREMQVLRAAAEGKSSAETAKELHLSFETVKTYRKRTIHALEARNMMNAIHHAHLLDILP